MKGDRRRRETPRKRTGRGRGGGQGRGTGNRVNGTKGTGVTASLDTEFCQRGGGRVGTRKKNLSASPPPAPPAGAGAGHAAPGKDGCRLPYPQTSTHTLARVPAPPGRAPARGRGGPRPGGGDAPSCLYVTRHRHPALRRGDQRSGAAPQAPRGWGCGRPAPRSERSPPFPQVELVPDRDPDNDGTKISVSVTGTGDRGRVCLSAARQA